MWPHLLTKPSRRSVELLMVVVFQHQHASFYKCQTTHCPQNLTESHHSKCPIIMMLGALLWRKECPTLPAVMSPAVWPSGCRSPTSFKIIPANGFLRNLFLCTFFFVFVFLFLCNICAYITFSAGFFFFLHCLVCLKSAIISVIHLTLHRLSQLSPPNYHLDVWGITHKNWTFLLMAFTQNVVLAAGRLTYPCKCVMVLVEAPIGQNNKCWVMPWFP